jgi:hypothetical protein
MLAALRSLRPSARALALDARSARSPWTARVPSAVRLLASASKGAYGSDVADEDDEGGPHDFMAEHPAIMRRIDAVKGLHAQHAGLCAELAERIDALEREYDAKLRPILARRAEIVSGASEPTEEEARPLYDYLAAMESPAGEAEAGIPGFWLTAITEHEALADSVTEADAAVLEYLVDVSCEKFGPGERAPSAVAAALAGETTAAAGGGDEARNADMADEETQPMPGFELSFTFAPNPYFSQRALSKVVWTEEGYPARTVASQIQWKQGKDVTHRVRVPADRYDAPSRARAAALCAASASPLSPSP